MIKTVVVLGGSITQSPWYTWKDYLEISSGVKIIDLSKRGIGNTYMAHSLLYQSMDPDSLIVVMLTSVDKFDWFVEDERFRSLQTEKHQPIKIDDRCGFWCTGSWFPEEKAIYKNTFFSLDWMCSQTITNILLYKEIAKKKNCAIEFFFDSPIWDYTEQDLIEMYRQKKNLPSRRMLELTLASQWSAMLDDALIASQTNSTIGYCWQNDLPWANDHYGTHPPSSSHWKFYNDIVRPRLTKHLPLPQIDLDNKISNMDQLWHRC